MYHCLDLPIDCPLPIVILFLTAFIFLDTRSLETFRSLTGSSGFCATIANTQMCRISPLDIMRAPTNNTSTNKKLLFKLEVCITVLHYLKAIWPSQQSLLYHPRVNRSQSGNVGQSD